ncbi:hypothetical protein V1509DRAFT_626084 [Lipomyces kononenkoae]
MSTSSRKLQSEINRILFVKNLSYSVTSEELYDLFGKFGSIRQIRLGNAQNTRGTAFVVFDDIQDAKMACDKLSGFNFQNRYLVVLYHQPDKVTHSATQGQAGATASADQKPMADVTSTPRRQI